MQLLEFFGALALIGVRLWVRTGRACQGFLSPRRPAVLDSETLTWAVRLRGWLSWLLAVWAGTRWYENIDDWSAWLDGSLSSMVEHAALVPALLLAMVLLPLTAMRGERRAILRGLLEPGRTLIISVAVVAAVIFAIDLLPRALSSLGMTPVGGDQQSVALMLLIAIATSVGMLAAAWLLSAWLVWGVPAVLRHMFRAHDAHPCYPAMLSMMLCVTSLFIGLVRAYEARWESPFPLWLHLLFLIGGPMGVAATGAAELWLLRTRHGISLRRAYWDYRAQLPR